MSRRRVGDVQKSGMNYALRKFFPVQFNFSADVLTNFLTLNSIIKESPKAVTKILVETL